MVHAAFCFRWVLHPLFSELKSRANHLPHTLNTPHPHSLWKPSFTALMTMPVTANAFRLIHHVTQSPMFLHYVVLQAAEHLDPGLMFGRSCCRGIILLGLLAGLAQFAKCSDGPILNFGVDKRPCTAADLLPALDEAADDRWMQLEVDENRMGEYNCSCPYIKATWEC